MSDSVRPHRRQPTRPCHPWDSPGKNTGVGCHFLLQCMTVKSDSEVAQSCPTLSDPMDCSYQAPPSMEFSRQEYWSGVPLPSDIAPQITYAPCFFSHSFPTLGWIWKCFRHCIFNLFWSLLQHLVCHSFHFVYFSNREVLLGSFFISFILFLIC